MIHRYHYPVSKFTIKRWPLVLTLSLLMGLLVLKTASAHGQEADSLSVLLTGIVKNKDNNNNRKTPPRVTMTGYINGDMDSILIENAPRWDRGEKNISGQGNYRLQFGNLHHLTAKDSIYLRFTDNVVGQQATISKYVDTIPWESNPLGSQLVLESVDLPERPQNVTLTKSENDVRTISWNAKNGINYVVYRRTLQDTLSDGRSRNLYTKISGELNGGTFTDSNESDTVNFAYIVYAKNEQGIYSSHSSEVKKLEQVSGLTVTTTTATNVKLNWNDYSPAVDQLGGYQVYRRTEADSSFGRPVAYTGKKSEYRDTRRNKGRTYYYKVEARDTRQNFMGLTPEVNATTKSSNEGYYRYANVKLAAIIYKNVNGDKISDSKVKDIKRQYEVARKFYWRNSKMRFNTEIDYYIIESKQNFSEPNLSNVAQRLKEQGVYNTQYDMVFAAWHIDSGYWSIGTGPRLNLPGPDRTTGFAQTQVPCGTGVIYPGKTGKDYCFTWIYIHENQHTIDDLYNRNGFPSMAHGDLPQVFNKPAGSHLDFQALMFRTFEEYLGLNSKWGDIMEVPDKDKDGMPDSDPRVPLDEAQFGSNSDKADTDGDGLDDRAEALSGNYSGSDPQHPHSDSDSLQDGVDAHPRYNIRPYIKKLPDSVSIKVDGNLSDWNGLDTRVSTGVSYVENGNSYQPNVQMAWSKSHLYISIRLNNIGTPKLRFEFEGDGRWFGAGNTRMSIDVSSGSFSEFRTWDARPEVREFSDPNPDDDHPGNGMWDTHPDYRSKFGRPVITKSSVGLGVSKSSEKVRIEIAIPKNSKAGLHLTSGDSLGWNINYEKVNNQRDNWASTFDQHSFEYFRLINEKATNLSAQKEVVQSYHLSQNYPNPFNPSTTISYQVPKSGHVKLEVYNAIGRKVTTLVNKQIQEGKHSVTFKGTNYSSGLYIYQLTTKDRQISKKMLLVK